MARPDEAPIIVRPFTLALAFSFCIRRLCLRDLLDAPLLRVAVHIAPIFFHEKAKLYHPARVPDSPSLALRGCKKSCSIVDLIGYHTTKEALPNESLDPCRAEVLAALKARRQYARAIARRGRHLEARVLQEQLIDDFGVEFGNADADTVEAMSDLVSTYHAVWDQEKAGHLARKLLALQ